MDLEEKKDEDYKVNYHTKKIIWYHPGEKKRDYSKSTFEHYPHGSPPWWWRSRWTKTPKGVTCTICNKQNGDYCYLDDTRKYYYYTCCNGGGTGCINVHECCKKAAGSEGCKSNGLDSVTSKVFCVYFFVFFISLQLVYKTVLFGDSRFEKQGK